MFCKHCGKEISSNSKLCTFCGKDTLKDGEQTEKDKGHIVNKGKNYLSKIVAIVVFILVFLVVKYAAQSGVSALFSDNNLEKSLTETSTEMNKGMPMTIDSVTQLTTTSVVGKELNYHYKYTGANPISQSDLDSSLKDSIINGDCTTTEARKLLDLGAGLIYNYYDSNGNYIGKISVQLSNCK